MSVYYCKINCLLGKYKRYIIVFVKKDTNKIGHTELLSNLPWISLQTREIEMDYKIGKHSYEPRLLQSLYKTIKIKERNKDCSTYSCDEYPILTITLLHDPNIKSEIQYGNTGTIVNALETYKTILTIR